MRRSIKFLNGLLAAAVLFSFSLKPGSASSLTEATTESVRHMLESNLRTKKELEGSLKALESAARYQKTVIHETNVLKVISQISGFVFRIGRVLGFPQFIQLREWLEKAIGSQKSPEEQVMIKQKLETIIENLVGMIQLADEINRTGEDILESQDDAQMSVLSEKQDMAANKMSQLSELLNEQLLEDPVLPENKSE